MRRLPGPRGEELRGGRRLAEVVVVVIAVVLVVQQHWQVAQRQEVPSSSWTGGTGSSESAAAGCVSARMATGSSACSGNWRRSDLQWSESGMAERLVRQRDVG